MAQDFFHAFGVDSANGKWTAEQEMKLREIFTEWDEDASGCLTKAEMRPMVKKMMHQGYKFKTITK